LRGSVQIQFETHADMQATAFLSCVYCTCFYNNIHVSMIPCLLLLDGQHSTCTFRASPWSPFSQCCCQFQPSLMHKSGSFQVGTFYV